MISGIYSNRNTKQKYYWDIVHEWEDVFKEVLGVSIILVGQEYDMIYKPSVYRKIHNRLGGAQLVDRFTKKKELYVAFHIGPPGVFSFYTSKNVIPVIIDFWKYENLKRFEKIFRNSPVVFVTSYEVYDYLKGQGVNLNLKHLPLSIPDYLIDDYKIPEKEIDVIQFGRQNKLLHDYMMKFVTKRPNVNYVYGSKGNNGINYISTVNGEIGTFDSRQKYLKILSKSRISLLSSPGIDDPARTGGFNPVTPRFLESASMGCHMLGNYIDSKDFQFCEVSKVCKSVSTYNEFESELEIMLESKAIPEYQSYLERFRTSKVAGDLLNIISDS